VGDENERLLEKLNADTGHAILTAAELDSLLQKLLLYAMPKMSNGLAKELFGKSLESLSAKSDQLFKSQRHDFARARED
jgi:hypothetical protein